LRRALAAGLSLALALAAHAQAPPEAPPPNENPTETQPAAPAAAPAPATSEAPPTETTPRPTKPAAPKTPRALPPAQTPAPAPAAQESPRDAEVAALRGEVSRLQSELDAERAAALTPPDERAPGAQPARSPWGWLVATALLALTAGFLLGWRLLDRRIRRRYGGLRIY
jgi:hypothetical protein